MKVYLIVSYLFGLGFEAFDRKEAREVLWSDLIEESASLVELLQFL